jgi:hypothetical protein
VRRTLLDGDKLHLVGLRPVGNAAMAVTDALQRFAPEERVVGAAAFFLLLCDRYNIEAGEAFRIASRVIKARHEGRPELNAVSAYLKYELR